MFQRIVIKAAIIAFACTASLAANAYAIDRKPIEIPAGELATALRTLASQAGVEFFYQTELVKGLRTEGVTGVLSAEEAVTKLLEGTSLTLQVDPSGAMLIARPPVSGPRVQGSEAETGASSTKSSPSTQTTVEGGQKKSFWDRFRVAQSEQTRDPEGSVDEPNAQTRQEERVELEEIVVTAQKREERLIDVPISIVAVSGDDLDKRNLTAIDDLSLAVPGLQVQSSGTYQRRIMLRGIGNLTGYSSSVGMYLDEATVTSVAAADQLDLRTYDLARVEVLRGPQGTLYGEGSVGGTVRFITNDPQLDRLTMGADITAMLTQDGDPSQRIEGVLNVPVVQDTLGLRIAGAYDQQGGWIDQPAADRNDFNDQDLINIRAKTLWRPLQQLTVAGMVVVHRNDSAPNRGEDADGNFTQAFESTERPSTDDDYEIYNLTLDYDFSAAQILSSSSYLSQDREIKNLGGRLQLLDPAAGFPPFEFLDVLFADRSTSFTQELRASSLGTGPWSWTLGGLYRHSRFNEDIPTFYFAFPGPLPSQGFSFQTGFRSESWAAFGDTSYKLKDRLTLGGGLRYFEDTQKGRLTDQRETFHSLNPRLYAQYALTTRSNLYASAAKGFRSGGVNGPGVPSFDPETVWNYELGSKMAFTDSASFELAVFYSDLKNYQIFAYLTPLDFLTSPTNAGNARIKGVEWGFAWQPAALWRLGLNGNYVHTEFYEISAFRSTVAVGDPINLIPKYSYSASAERAISWNGKQGFVRLDYDHHGRSVFRDRTVGAWYSGESDIIDMLNLSASLQWNSNVSVKVFAQNLLNDRGFTDPVTITGDASRSRPRTFGISLGVNFD
jgi:iron complex outermembrane recepter protein